MNLRHMHLDNGRCELYTCFRLIFFHGRILLQFFCSFRNRLGYFFFMSSIVLHQCFLLQLISSAQAERPTNISSSMMKVFQRGLLTQRCIFCAVFYCVIIYEDSSFALLYYDANIHCLNRDKEAPRLSESGFQFLVYVHKWGGFWVLIGCDL